MKQVRVIRANNNNSVPFTVQYVDSSLLSTVSPQPVVEVVHPQLWLPSSPPLSPHESVCYDDPSPSYDTFSDDQLMNMVNTGKLPPRLGLMDFERYYAIYKQQQPRQNTQVKVQLVSISNPIPQANKVNSTTTTTTTTIPKQMPKININGLTQLTAVQPAPVQTVTRKRKIDPSMKGQQQVPPKMDKKIEVSKDVMDQLTSLLKQGTTPTTAKVPQGSTTASQNGSAQLLGYVMSNGIRYAVRRQQVAGKTNAKSVVPNRHVPVNRVKTMGQIPSGSMSNNKRSTGIVEKSQTVLNGLGSTTTSQVKTAPDQKTLVTKETVKVNQVSSPLVTVPEPSPLPTISGSTIPLGVSPLSELDKMLQWDETPLENSWINLDQFDPDSFALNFFD